MNTNSHLYFGMLLNSRLREITGVKLPKSTFALANCWPDYSIKYKKIPHYKSYMLPSFCDMINDLMEMDNDQNINIYVLAEKLGIICHFVCDFFCYAHNDEFKGNLRDHFKYEFKLNGVLKDQKSYLKKHIDENIYLNDTVNVLSVFDKCYEEYDSVGRSFENDIRYSLVACECIMIPILKKFVVRNQIAQRRLVSTVA